VVLLRLYYGLCSVCGAFQELRGLAKMLKDYNRKGGGGPKNNKKGGGGPQKNGKGRKA